ncbi:unnamed protein product [Notodromas monacha]|uniref:O-acyltransferase WSD1 C-terminal domain-containing protein n=1 Tax=Notodromas monacha TaxID=399045 RepID=A0A7R9BD65_9CRUS|nr:unnamed protein product [Notodromas monacha]CAG0913201.1 unnamed protein product [Notodromas monacha]
MLLLAAVYAVTVPVLAVLSVFYAVALSWKLCVWVALRCRHGRSAAVLSGADAISQFPLLRVNEAANNMVVRIAGRVSLPDLRRRFRENLLDVKRPNGAWKHPKLRQYFTEFLGLHVALPDPEFEFEPHFDYYYDSGETPVTYRDERDLSMIVEDLVNAQHWERPTMAPWRIFLLPRRDEQEHVLLVKADHAIFDAGAAVMVLFPSIADGDAAAKDLFRNMAHVSRWRRAWLHFRGLMILPFGTLMQFFNEPDWNPIHRHDRNSKEGKFVAFPQVVPLWRLNDIRHATDVKINSIVLTCVSRAVCRFVEHRFGSSSTSSVIDGSSEKPWTWTCHQPVSMWMPGDSPELVNRISAVATPLPMTTTVTGSEGSAPVVEPITRLTSTEHLQIVKEQMARVFVADAIWSGYTFLRLGINTVPKWVTVPLARRSFTHPTLGLSNVRCAEAGYTVFGHPVTLITGFLPLIKTWDLGVVVTSYNGDMAITVTGRKSAFSSAEEMKQIQSYIMEEIDDLHRMAKQLVASKNNTLPDAEQTVNKISV